MILPRDSKNDNLEKEKSVHNEHLNNRRNFDDNYKSNFFCGKNIFHFSGIILKSEKLFIMSEFMTLLELKNKITKKENYATELDLEISSSKNKMREEQDPAHIVFWNDYIGLKQFELDSTNCELFLLRQKLKTTKNNQN